MSAPGPLRVLVLENRRTWSIDEVERPRRDGERPIAVIRDICATAVDAIDAIEEDEPDAILVDNFVPWEVELPQAPWAVRTVIEISKRYGFDWPLRILWTTRPFYPDELAAYAFCHYGGHNIADKDVDEPEAAVAQVLRATADGEHWRPPRIRTPGEDQERLVRDNLDIIAAVDAGMSNRAIGEWLGRLRGRPPYPATSISVFLTRLRDALGVAPNEQYEKEGKRSEIVQAAYTQGWRWIKPEYRYMADGLDMSSRPRA